MKRFLLPVFSLTLLALALLTACTSNSRIISTGLELEITGIERTGEGTAAISWHIKNTNIVAYLLSHLSHKIQLNGTTLGTIDENEPLGLPAHTNAGRTSKLIITDAAANRVLNEAVNTGSANYHIDTQITILVYDDTKEKATLSGSGTVAVVKAK